MQNEMVFYTHPWSRGRTTRWMLEECQASYKTEILEYGTSMKSEPYLSINPMGKVPALKYNNHIITECVAICAFLADLFPERNLTPSANSPFRGDYYRWLFFTSGPLESAVMNKHLGFIASDEQKEMLGYGCLEDVINTLEISLKGKKYLCGEYFSTADLYLSSALNWFMQFDLLPKLAVFEDYLAHHVKREAFMKASKIDDELMEKHPAPNSN